MNQRSAVPGVTNRVRKPVQEKTISKYTKQQIDKIAKRKSQQDASPLPKKKSKRSTTPSYDMWGDGMLVIGCIYMNIVAHCFIQIEPAAEPVEENSYLDVVKERKVNVSEAMGKREQWDLQMACVLHRLLSPSKESQPQQYINQPLPYHMLVHHITQQWKIIKPF